jgi:hypothetical protein
MTIVACMGGFCPVRDRCAHYHAVSRTVSERLCERGREEPEPIPATERRFDAWIAGMTAEQAERFRRQQLQRELPPVPDEDLPPALRGGALGVY